MSDAELQVYDRLNDKGRRRILLQARLDKTKQRYTQKRDVLKAKYDFKINQLESQIARHDDRLWQDIDENRDQLTPNGERSFTTLWVRFQFKKLAGSVKIKDAEGIIKMARKRRALRQIGRRVWLVDNKKFLDYLEANPQEYKYYQEFIEEAPEHETLSIKLNEGHNEIFDNTRLTPKAVPVKRSSPR